MVLNDFGEYKGWFKKCKGNLLNSEYLNPFPRPPIAVNLYNNPPIFCYGRDEYIEEILNEVKDSIKNPEPNLIRIIGKQGIGKSTVICWVMKELEEIYDVPIVYLETSAQPEDFNMKSLYRQIISIIEKRDILNKLIFNSISKFIKAFKDAGGRLYKEISEKFSGEEIEYLINNSEFIKNKIQDPSFNQKFFDLLKNNIILIKDYIPVDPNFLLIFWKSHVQNPEIIKTSNAFRGNMSYEGYNIETDYDASNSIDELINFNRWLFNNETVFVLIFDHLEAGISEQKEGVYSNLFSLLLNLRHKKYLTIIISGTLDAYSAFDEILQEDQKLQLDNWSKTIALTTLKPDNVIRIVNEYLSIFWNKFNFQPPPKNALFPFGEKSIKYLYENNGLDLRKTLKNLYELIEKYRYEKELEYVDDFFKAFKTFRKREDVALSFIEQQELVKKLMDKSIQDKNRSTLVEMALYQFFDIVRSHPDYKYLTDVKHEPPLGRSEKRPDVFLEFFGNEGQQYVKKLGIEVKMYRKTDKISKGDINKTYILLKENALDYVTWISNVPLDIKYRYSSISKELTKHIGRISPLDDLELAYIAFMVYFNEIYGRDPKIEEIEFTLNKIDLNPLNMREKLKSLPKLTEIELPKPSIEITSFLKPEEIIIKTPIRDNSIKPRKPPKVAVEIGQEEIKLEVEKYIKSKSRTNQQITSHYTIKAIQNALNLKDQDTKLDEEIWAIALNISKSYGFKHSPKTIYF